MNRKPEHIHPPRLAQRLLKKFAGKADLEDIQGDLDEVFEIKSIKESRQRANIMYWKHVFSIIFSYGLRKRKSKAAYSSFYHKNSIAMFKNYFKIAIRSFSKHKLFTSLNVFGLALGMSICLIALTVVVTVNLLDEFHVKKDRIYQVNTLIGEGLDQTNYSSTFHATGDYLNEVYPFIEEVVNIRSDFKPIVDHHGYDLNFSGYYADQAFFEVFSFHLKSGNPATALINPFSVVLTEKTAKKLFRDEDPLGKTIDTDMGTFNVTGVMEDLHQTHFFFEMLTSYETFKSVAPLDLKNDWKNFRNHYSYILLKEGTDRQQLNNALDQTTKISNAFHPNKTIKFRPINVADIVPVKWNNSNALGVGWDQEAIVFFIAIGILMLLPAVFNHINLSIARSLKRAKEIGIRKVIGAQKGQIKWQFIIETILMSIIALVVSFFIMVPMKEGFMDMVYFSEVVDTDLNIYQALIFLLFAILVGLFTGFFPAKYFARLTPSQTLKGDVLDGKSGVNGYKKGLFVFQFFVSLVFIIGVAAISKQYAFVINNNHGFESNNVLTIPFYGMDKQLAMNELGSHPDVKSITASSSLPGIPVSSSVEATSNNIDTIQTLQVYTADHFIENMDIELVWGESGLAALSNKNEEAVMVNQEFIKSLKVYDDQIDTLRFTLADGTKCKIVGILKDFNFEPLNELISPLLIRHSLSNSHFALLTVSSSNIKGTIIELEQIWKGMDQEEGFQATFLNEEIEEAYSIVLAQLKFFSILSILAITVSCLGLLGMATYTTENRTKEIAVRKIMGATNKSLYYLLTKDFIKLIGIASLIAIPFSYVFYDKVFLYLLIRYGTGLGAAEVIVSVIFLFFIGAASIYSQTAKVTKANPATKLRYE